MNILTLLQTIATLLTATLTQAIRTSKLTYDGLSALKGYIDLKSSEIAQAYTAAIATASQQAKNYTDDAVALINQSLTTINNTLGGVPTAIATALQQAKNYTDDAVGDLSTTLTQAIATAKQQAQSYAAGLVQAEADNRSQAITDAIEPINTTLSGHTSTLANHTTRIGVLENGTFGAFEQAISHPVSISGTSNLTDIFAADATAQGFTVKPNKTYVLLMDSDVEGEETITYNKPTTNGLVSEVVTVSGGEKFIIKTDANGAVEYARYVRDPNAEAMIDIKNGMTTVKDTLTTQNALLLAQNEQLNTLVVTLQGLIPN